MEEIEALGICFVLLGLSPIVVYMMILSFALIPLCYRDYYVDITKYYKRGFANLKPNISNTCIVLLGLSLIIVYMMILSFALNSIVIWWLLCRTN